MRVNFHFILDSNNEGNFRPDDDGLGNTNYTGYDFVRILMDKVNERYSFNEKMNLPCPNNTPILPKRVQFICKGVYFHKDNDYFDVTGTNLTPSQYFANKCSEINIFILRKKSARGVYNEWGLGDKFEKSIYLHNTWLEYQQNQQHIPDNLLAHEIGHVLGLEHTWTAATNQCSDTPPNPNLWVFVPCDPNNPDPNLQSSNNLMDYNSNKNALSPCQIDIVHNFIQNNLMDYVEYCFLDNTVCDQSQLRCTSQVCLRSSSNFIIQSSNSGYVCSGNVMMDARATFKASYYRIQIVETPLRYSNTAIGPVFDTGWLNGSPGLINLNTYFNFQSNHNYKIILMTRNDDCNYISTKDHWITYSNDPKYCSSCCPSNSIIIDNNVDISSALQQIQNCNGASICISQSNVNIPQSLILSNKKILLSEDAKVYVNGDIQLESCDIRACGPVMWYSIQMAPFRNIQLKNCHVQDGLYAFDVPLAVSMEFTGNTFKNNYISLSLYGGGFYGPDFVDNTFLGGLLNPNSLGVKRSDIGLYGSFSGTLGDASSQSNMNFFQNLNRGILSLDASISVLYSQFISCQTGIQSYRSNLNVESSNFSSTDWGIDAKGGYLDLSFNNFLNFKAAVLHTQTGDGISAFKNKFTNGVQVGIYLSGIFNPNYSIVNVKENEFSTIYPNSMGMILVNNVPNKVSVNIEKNVIENVGFGIHLHGFHRPSNILNTQVLNNEIYLSGQNDAFGRAGYGIGLSYCDQIQVGFNTIGFHSTAVNNSPVIGIYHEWSSNVYLNDNLINGKDILIYFEHGILGRSEGMGQPMYHCNRIHSAKYGITFHQAYLTMLNKAMGSSTQPAGNGFYQVQYDTYAWYTELSDINLPNNSLVNYGYYYGNGNNRSVNGITYRIKPMFNTSSGSGELKRIEKSRNPQCNYFFNTHALQHFPPQKNIKSVIALNQMKSSKVKQFYAKLELLKEILMDTTLLDSSADYVQFYYTHLGSNLYKMALAEKLFADNDTLAAISTIQTVMPDTLLEEEYKKMFLIKYSGNNLTLSDTVYVDSLANLPDSLGYHIVYASLLNFELKSSRTTGDLRYLYADLGTQQQKSRMPLIINETTEVDEEQNLFVLYPNPVDKNLDVFYEGTEKKAYIYNVIGELIEMIELNENNQLNTTHYPNGVYIIKIGNEHAKFVVQH